MDRLEERLRYKENAQAKQNLRFINRYLRLKQYLRQAN